jgi:hypothetical protein
MMRITEPIRDRIQLFLEKVINIKVLSIDASLLVPMERRFFNISNLSIYYSPFYPNAINIQEFIMLHSWKYLKHLEIENCCNETFSCLCNQLLTCNTKLFSLQLTRHQIDRSDLIIDTFISKQTMLQKCTFTTHQRHSQAIQHLQLLLCQSNLEIFKTNRIDDELLDLIGKQCHKLREIYISESHFTKQKFQDTIIKLKKLNIYHGDIYFFNGVELSKLTQINIYESLNRHKMILFLTTFQKVASLSFTIDEYYQELPVLMNKCVNLTSLHIDFNNFPDAIQFTALLDHLPLGQLKYLTSYLKNTSIDFIVPYFSHFLNLEQLTLIIINHQQQNRILAEQQIMSFLQILDSLPIINKCIKIIDIQFCIFMVSIPDHHRRFLAIQNKFPNIEKVRLGSEFFYFKPRFLF